MSPDLKFIGSIFAIPALFLSFPILPVASSLPIALAQVQINQDSNLEGFKILQEGIQLYGQNRYAEALAMFQRCLVIFKQNDDRNNISLTLNFIASSHEELAEYPQALAAYQEALVTFKQSGDRQQEAISLNNIGSLYSKLNQFNQALDFYQQALAIFKQLNVKERIGITLHNIGFVYSNLRQYHRAIEFYQQALAIRREIGDRAGLANSINNIGNAYDNLEQYPQALQFFQQALAIYREVGDRRAEASTIGQMGGVYASLGQYANALELYQQGLAIAQQNDNRPEAANILNSIGLVYLSIGQYERALKIYQQALEIYSNLSNKEAESAILINLGLSYSKLKEREKALDFYQRSLAIVENLNLDAKKGQIFNNIGAVYEDLEQYSQALDFYQKALAVAQERKDKYGTGVILNNIGLLYDRLGESDRALNLYQQAIPIFREINRKDGESITLHNIGITQMQMGNHSEASKTLLAAAKLSESLRTGLKDADKISFFETQEETYIFLQKALVAQNQFAAALEVAERGRARAFVELLASRLSANNSATISAPPSIAEIKRIAKEQNATLVEYSIVDIKLRGEKIMESAIYIWVVKPSGEIIFRRSDLKPFNSSIKNLVANGRNFEDAEALQKLHQLLIEPIVEFLPTGESDRVIFIPHGSLFLVPFPALKDRNGKRLIEKYTILTAPAIQVLDLTRKQKQRLRTLASQNQDLIIVGNPTMPKISPMLGDPEEQLSSLPGTEREAIAIAELLNTQALIGNAATKAAVVQRMPQARLIHLATHGLLDDFGFGVPGAIALAPSKEDNGFLTAGEILDLQLNAQLVVLSACNTGRGKITGDGVIGLSRSLISAGVPSVIVSLWAVPDAPTALLMTEFYRNWQSGANKAVALRQAMLTTMAKYPNPRDWAGFTLIGEVD